MPYGEPEPPSANKELFGYWKECEQVAMHFNELLIRFRLQAIAALAASGGLLGIAAKGSSAESWLLLAGGLAFLLAVWVAVGLIDFLYYYQLLRGAVAEVKAVERKSGGKLGLSSAIEDKCPGWQSRLALVLFYGFPAVMLTALLYAVVFIVR